MHTGSESSTSTSSSRIATCIKIMNAGVLQKKKNTRPQFRDTAIAGRSADAACDDRVPPKTVEQGKNNRGMMICPCKKVCECLERITYTGVPAEVCVLGIIHSWAGPALYIFIPMLVLEYHTLSHARVPSGRPPAARRAGCTDRQHAGPLENHNADRRLAGARCSQSRVRLRVLILYLQFLCFEIRITFLFSQSKYLRRYRLHCDCVHRLITGSTITRIYHRGGWDWHAQSFLKFWRLAAPTEEDPTASLIFVERTGWVLESSQRNRSAAASAVDGEFVEMSIRYSFPTQPSELWQRVPPPS
jgi:hypothetical protein